MKKQEKIEFRMFCEQATLEQLENIVQKEREAARNSNYRKACYKIAKAVQSERGR